MSVVYEVTLTVDSGIAEEFDDWLEQHVADMLELPGFVGAETFHLESDDEHKVRRVTRYTLQSKDELDAYLAGQAAAMRQEGIDRFGDRFRASRRILSPSVVRSSSHTALVECRNCGATLGGQYCGNCGQRASSRMISIWELTRDAFGDLFELDSRLWRTLIPLLFRPGKLTRDYLEGRRARYMPPFRTYLVLSIIFFLVAFFDPEQEFSFLFEPAPPTAEEQLAADQQEKSALRREIISELESEGIVVGGGGSSAPDGEAGRDERPGINLTIPKEDDQNAGLTISIDEDAGETDCDMDDLVEADMPVWFAKRLTPERMQAVCENVLADEGKTLGTKVIENVPAGLIILLPLMALALKMLYPLSKRYYVEHLLFFVHFHAFFFLILILQITFARVSDAVNFSDAIAGVVLFASSMYIPVYLYKGMRRVYGQGHLLTVPKYLALVLTYFFGFTMMLAVALLFAAFSI